MMVRVVPSLPGLCCGWEEVEAGVFEIGYCEVPVESIIVDTVHYRGEVEIAEGSRLERR